MCSILTKALTIEEIITSTILCQFLNFSWKLSLSFGTMNKHYFGNRNGKCSLEKPQERAPKRGLKIPVAFLPLKKWTIAKNCIFIYSWQYDPPKKNSERVRNESTSIHITQSKDERSNFKVKGQFDGRYRRKYLKVPWSANACWFVLIYNTLTITNVAKRLFNYVPYILL